MGCSRGRKSREGWHLNHSPITQLAPREKQIFDLRQQGITFRRIAEMLKISYGTVSSIYYRALEKIEDLNQNTIEMEEIK